MFRQRYAAAPRAATPARHLFPLLVIMPLLLLAACVPKKEVAQPGQPPEKPFVRLAPSPHSAAEIRAIMQRALRDEAVDEAVLELERLAREAPAPIAEEAAFRRVEIKLRFRDPDAREEAEALLARYPDHALTPYAHMWLAKWHLEQEEDAAAMRELRRVVAHPRLTRELATEALALGASLTHVVSEEAAVRWYLRAAGIDAVQREHWLRLAAARASMATIETLHEEGRLARPHGDTFYLFAARARLMTGEMAEVDRIAGLLAADAPRSPLLATVRRWAAGEMRMARIGVLLPLSGDYARFGERSLRGIRIAFESFREEGKAILRIEDTGGTPAGAVGAYRRLINDGVEVVVGPLLGETAEALLPHLRPDVPLISLTSRTELAGRSPALFVHTLALTVQASFMADYAWRQGERRVVVLHRGAGSAEAAAFRNAFESLGGEVVESLELPEGAIDHRDALKALRARTDDEELLAVLDEELLFSPVPDALEIRMPVNFDALYLALPGKSVALLGGQLAYVGIRDVPIYGSERWRDGQLLFDRGRYLSSARFSGVELAEREGALRRLRLGLRDAWGEREPTKLAALAFDTTLIANLLTSRLGLSGRRAVEGLKELEGFPGLTGHVRFDGEGVGYKRFRVYTIRRGEIVPAG